MTPNPRNVEFWGYLFLVVWRLRDACELVWWLETSENGFADISKLHVTAWERSDNGIGRILKLHVASWERLDDLLEALGNTLGGLELILEVFWGPWSWNFVPKSKVILFLRHLWRDHFWLILDAKWKLDRGPPSTTEFATIVNEIRKAYANVDVVFIFDLTFSCICDATVRIFYRHSQQKHNLYRCEFVIEYYVNSCFWQRCWVKCWVHVEATDCEFAMNTW